MDWASTAVPKFVPEIIEEGRAVFLRQPTSVRGDSKGTVFLG
jgi:hypothetical protein